MNPTPPAGTPHHTTHQKNYYFFDTILMPFSHIGIPAIKCWMQPELFLNIQLLLTNFSKLISCLESERTVYLEHQERDGNMLH